MEWVDSAIALFYLCTKQKKSSGHLLDVARVLVIFNNSAQG